MLYPNSIFSTALSDITGTAFPSFQAKHGADSSHNHVRTLSAHAARRGSSSPPSALVAAASCSARSCPSPPQERAQGQSPAATARERTAAFSSARSTQPRARSAPHTPSPGCGAPRPPPLPHAAAVTPRDGEGREGWGGSGEGLAVALPAGCRRARPRARPPPRPRGTVGDVSGRRGTGRRCIRFLGASGAACLPPLSPVRSRRGRLRAERFPERGGGNPRLAASPTGGEAAAESRDGAAAAGGLGSLGGGTAPGDGAERGAAAPLPAGRGERRAEAPRHRRLCRAPPPRFCFPFRCRLSVATFLFIYLFSQRVGTRGGESRAAGTSRLAGRRRQPRHERRRRGGEAGAEPRLASARLAHRTAPLPPRLPWPPEAPAAARPHDGLNRHLHQVHRRVPALRGAREVSTQPAGRGAAASGSGVGGGKDRESGERGGLSPRGQRCEGRRLQPRLVPGRCFKGESRSVRPPDPVGAYSPGGRRSLGVPAGSGR